MRLNEVDISTEGWKGTIYIEAETNICITTHAPPVMRRPYSIKKTWKNKPKTVKPSIYMATISFIILLYWYLHRIHPLNMTLPNSLAKLHAASFAVTSFTKTTMSSVTSYPRRWNWMAICFVVTWNSGVPSHFNGIIVVWVDGSWLLKKTTNAKFNQQLALGSQ